MNSQKKLTELYENKIAQTSEHVEELNSLVRDIEAQLETATQENERILKEAVKEKHRLEDQLRQKEAQVQKFKTELETINESLGRDASGTENGSKGVSSTY